MRLSDSTIADASDTSYVLETPAQFFARGGVVTVVVPSRARGFVDSLIKAKRQRVLKGNTVGRTDRYETVSDTHSNTGHRRHGRVAPSLALHHRPLHS
jgi:hypothetical protein